MPSLFSTFSLYILFTFIFLSFYFTGRIKSSENQLPFNNEAYSAFKRGNVVKGILCPSLTNSFRARSLERSYLTYSHRQRQKSLLIVNIVDLMLKIVLAIVWTWRKSSDVVCIPTEIGYFFSLVSHFNLIFFLFSIPNQNKKFLVNCSLFNQKP